MFYNIVVIFLRFGTLENHTYQYRQMVPLIQLKYVSFTEELYKFAEQIQIQTYFTLFIRLKKDQNRMM